MPLKKHAVLLVTASIATFVIHILSRYIMDIPLWADKIILAYVLNTILALAILVALVRVKDRFQNSLGFLFLGSSFIKFIFFFLVFYKSYNLDGETSRTEFAAFFVPYAVCLVFETRALVKILSKED